ncbi:MAG: hypothetical protein QW632_01230 [Ignisphaera sp.]
MSSKSVKRINMFLLINDENQLDFIVERLKNICKECTCSFNVRRSNIIERFYYIAITIHMNVEEVKKHIEELTKEIDPFISWHKIEVIEVR